MALGAVAPSVGRFTPPGAALMPARADAVSLSGGSKPFPLVSFGLQVYDDDTARKLTLTALEVRLLVKECSCRLSIARESRRSTRFDCQELMLTQISGSFIQGAANAPGTLHQ